MSNNNTTDFINTHAINNSSRPTCLHTAPSPIAWVCNALITLSSSSHIYTFNNKIIIGIWIWRKFVSFFFSPFLRYSKCFYLCILVRLLWNCYYILYIGTSVQILNGVSCRYSHSVISCGRYYIKNHRPNCVWSE